MRMIARWARPRARAGFFLGVAVGVISRRHQELALKRRYDGAKVEDAVDVISCSCGVTAKDVGRKIGSLKAIEES